MKESYEVLVGMLVVFVLYALYNCACSESFADAPVTTEPVVDPAQVKPDVVAQVQQPPVIQTMQPVQSDRASDVHVINLSRKDVHMQKKAEMEAARVAAKQAQMAAVAARMQAAVPLSMQDKAALVSLSPEDKQSQLDVSQTQQALLQDQITTKKIEIESLKTQIASLDNVIDTVAPPSIGKRFGRLFKLRN